MNSECFDIIVIGAGIGGYTAAVRAAQEGKRTAVVEKGLIGGTCLNRGCIPTKNLVFLSNQYAMSKSCINTGIFKGDLQVSSQGVAEEMKKNIHMLRNGMESLLSGYGVTVISGEAFFIDGRHLKVRDQEGEKRYQAEYYIIASGMLTERLDFPGNNLPNVMSADQFLGEAFVIPEKAVIVGGGVAGIELASALSGFGSKVSIVEKASCLLGEFPEEVRRVAERNLERKDIEVYLNTQIEEIAEDDGLNVFLMGPLFHEVLECSHVIVTAGKRFNTSCISDFQELTMKHGRIQTDSWGRTSVDHIYAVGDVCGGRFAYVAARQAEIAVEHICHGITGQKPGVIPYCIFSDPEIAFVGDLTGSDAGDLKISGSFPMAANGRSVTERKKDGFVKLYADQEDHVVGGLLVCSHASDFIHYVAELIDSQITVEELSHTMFVHPTFAEAIGEAAKRMKKRSVNIRNL